eukprot:11082322-Ditylum_brightwellii.AAC.1
MMKTQQSAMIGVQINDEDSTISRDLKWGNMTKDWTGTMKTQQSVMIGVQINDEDSTISRDWRWDDMTKLN